MAKTRCTPWLRSLVLGISVPLAGAWSVAAEASAPFVSRAHMQAAECDEKADDGRGIARRPTRADPLTIYINFDGAELAFAEVDDASMNLTQIEAMAGSYPAFEGDDEERYEIVDGVRRDFAKMGAVVVTERPPDDVDYTMVMVGEHPGTGEENEHGIAPLDCGDANPRNIAFSFVYGIGMAELEATLISHELGHTFGLEHVQEARAIMFDTLGIQADVGFITSCATIDTSDGSPEGGHCVVNHALHCGMVDGRQNSHAELVHYHGGPITDEEDPTIELTAPMDGDSFENGDAVMLAVTASDNHSIEKVEFFVDEREVSVRYNAPYQVSVPILTGGEHTVHALVHDVQGNSAVSSMITINIEDDGLDGGVGSESDSGAGSGDLTMGSDASGEEDVGMGTGTAGSNSEGGAASGLTQGATGRAPTNASPQSEQGCCASEGKGLGLWGAALALLFGVARPSRNDLAGREN